MDLESAQVFKSIHYVLHHPVRLRARQKKSWFELTSCAKAQNHGTYGWCTKVELETWVEFSSVRH